jgi:excisionase family DNA binding protein
MYTITRRKREKMPLKFSGLKLYSVDEVAELLKSTKSTIRAYFREGKIKGQKVTGKWYITEDNLKKYLSGDYPVPIK